MMMRRFVAVLAVAAPMVAMMVLMAGPAVAEGSEIGSCAKQYVANVVPELKRDVTKECTPAFNV